MEEIFPSLSAPADRFQTAAQIGCRDSRQAPNHASVPVRFHSLHSATQPPVTAKVLLHRASSRGLLLSSAISGPHTSPPPNAQRRSSIIATIPEGAQSKETHFRRRHIMSMSDADSLCLICHNDFSKGGSGIQELQCSHIFHKQCIDEWLWSKQSCPTCQIHVSMPQPFYWNSTRMQLP
ncbi:hypothetical protein CRUP_038091 [Coryphaenoides rupestris]|nr:hypothetical protein CRUP_038091 [Coryphaenoides rupestris]